MDKSDLERIKGLSREERTEFFKQHKDEVLALSANDLSNVNGGYYNSYDIKVLPNENPNTEEVPYKRNYYTSWGFVCAGEVIC